MYDTYFDIILGLFTADECDKFEENFQSVCQFIFYR